jgi:putative sterol carrier protein
MAVDIQKLFNEEVPAKIAGNSEAAKQINATYQFVIEGDDSGPGGEWFINVKDDPKCVAGNPGNAECTLKLKAADFQTLMEDPKTKGMQLFFSAKLKVEGNNMLAMKLQKLFEL